MGDQLHVLTAVLPGKWAISHCKYGSVGPRAGPDGYAPTGVQIRLYSLYQVATSSTLSPLPAIQRVMVCLWHTVGEKIMKILLHKDLCEPNSTFAFYYVMIHLFISFLNYIKPFKIHAHSSITHIFLTTFHTGFITLFN
jgi:hypothetical protein